MAYDEAYNRPTENNTYCNDPSGSGSCGVYAAVSGIFQTPDGKYSGTVTEDSSIKEYLNNTYYPTLTVLAKTQMQSHSFNIGSVEWLPFSGNDSIEKNIAGEKMFEWTGNVGLVNVSDLLRASTNIACTSASDELYAVVGPTMKETCGSYLTEMSVGSEGIAYWTINAFSSENSDVQSAAWIVSFVKGYGGLFLYREAYYNNMIGARPVVFLRSSIQIMGGNGTKENPYTIV